MVKIEDARCAAGLPCFSLVFEETAPGLYYTSQTVVKYDIIGTAVVYQVHMGDLSCRAR